MSSSSQVVKDEFRDQLNPVLPRDSETTEDDGEGAQPPVTRTRRRAITFSSFSS